MWHLANRRRFSFQGTGLSDSAFKQCSTASGYVAVGGSANRVPATFLSIHDKAATCETVRLFQNTVLTRMQDDFSFPPLNLVLKYVRTF